MQTWTTYKKLFQLWSQKSWLLRRFASVTPTLSVLTQLLSLLLSCLALITLEKQQSELAKTLDPFDRELKSIVLILLDH